MARRGDGIYQRGKTWWLDFVHDGRRHHARLGKGINRTVAGELASVQRAAILKGEAGIGGPKRKDLVFDKAADEYLAWADANKRSLTAKTYRACIERLRAVFGTKRLGELSPFDLERYKRGRIDAGVMVMVNRELQCLRSLYNRCAEWGLYEGSNPAAHVKPLRESPGRLRFLEPQEEARLLAAAPEPLRSMIIVGIHGGVRLVSEGLTLRWADVDLRRNLMTVQGAYAKSGKPRTIPLNTTVRATLAKLRQEAPDGAEWVFAHRDGSPYRRIGTTFRDDLCPDRPVRRDAARAAPHLRVSPGHGGRRPADDSGAGWLGVARHGDALHASVADPQGRRRRAHCVPEFPDAIHDSAISGKRRAP